jgi:TPP-dependent 2-oxoacid decarboxylase
MASPTLTLGIRNIKLRCLFSLATKNAHTGGPVLIECPLNRDDCSKQLAEWGSHVAKANARV